MWPFPLKNWKKCWNHFYKAFPKEYPVILIIFLKSEQKKWNCLHCTSPTLQNLFIPFLSFLARIQIRIFFCGSGSANSCGPGPGKNMRIRIRNNALNIWTRSKTYNMQYTRKVLTLILSIFWFCSYPRHFLLLQRPAIKGNVTTSCYHWRNWRGMSRLHAIIDGISLRLANIEN